MRIISKRVLNNFSEKYPDARTPLDTWYNLVKKTRWNNTNDIKRHYASASILKKNRVVFNIGGNKYRLVVKVEYPKQEVYIRFIGTHNEYNKINAEEI
jgi:mRNA interferase HigB